MRAWAKDEGVRWVLFFAWCLLAIGLGLLTGAVVGGVAQVAR